MFYVVGVGVVVGVEVGVVYVDWFLLGLYVDLVDCIVGGVVGVFVDWVM